MPSSRRLVLVLGTLAAGLVVPYASPFTPVHFCEAHQACQAGNGMDVMWHFAAMLKAMSAGESGARNTGSLIVWVLLHAAPFALYALAAFCLMLWRRRPAWIDFATLGGALGLSLGTPFWISIASLSLSAYHSTEVMPLPVWYVFVWHFGALNTAILGFILGWQLSAARRQGVPPPALVPSAHRSSAKGIVGKVSSRRQIVVFAGIGLVLGALYGGLYAPLVGGIVGVALGMMPSGSRSLTGFDKPLHLHTKWSLLLFFGNLPLLIASVCGYANGTSLALWWVDVTRPLVSLLAPVIPTIDDYAQQLSRHGYDHRIPIVQHALAVSWTYVLLAGGFFFTSHYKHRNDAYVRSLGTERVGVVKLVVSTAGAIIFMASALYLPISFYDTPGGMKLHISDFSVIDSAFLLPWCFVFFGGWLPFIFMNYVRQRAERRKERRQARTG